VSVLSTFQLGHVIWPAQAVQPRAGEGGAPSGKLERERCATADLAEMRLQPPLLSTNKSRAKQGTGGTHFSVLFETMFQ
jgi:hypothetical protein